MTALSFVQISSTDAAKALAFGTMERNHGDGDEQLFFYKVDRLDFISLIKLRIKFAASQFVFCGAEGARRGEFDIQLGVDGKGKISQTTAAFKHRGRLYSPGYAQDAARRGLDADERLKRCRCLSLIEEIEFLGKLQGKPLWRYVADSDHHFKCSRGLRL